jgi:hypothetical protein
MRNLARLRAAGIRAPRPLQLRSHVLVMEFVGADGVAAPRLKARAGSPPLRSVGSHAFCCAGCSWEHPECPGGAVGAARMQCGGLGAQALPSVSSCRRHRMRVCCEHGVTAMARPLPVRTRPRRWYRGGLHEQASARGAAGRARAAGAAAGVLYAAGAARAAAVPGVPPGARGPVRVQHPCAPGARAASCAMG